MIGGIEHREAALVVEAALGAVYDPALVRQLREDSPLSVLGVTPADAVCIADAIAARARDGGWACELGDADLSAAGTVADLVSAVLARATVAGA